MQPLQITPPYGYDEIVLSDIAQSAAAGPGVTPGFCHAINALAVSTPSFVAASRDYPIVCAPPATTAPHSCRSLVLGLALRQNLFITAQGDWDPGPLMYLHSYDAIRSVSPSSMWTARPAASVCGVLGEGASERARCRSVRGVGAPTPQWASIEKLLTEYETDLDLTRADVRRPLPSLGLFSPFQFQVIESGVAGSHAGRDVPHVTRRRCSP